MNNSLESEFFYYSESLDLLSELKIVVEQMNIKADPQETDIVKKAESLLKTELNPEIKDVIAQLLLKIKDLELELLRKEKSDKEEFIFDEGRLAYFKSTDKNKLVPYCANCMNNNKGQWILTNIAEMGIDNISHKCPKCNSMIGYDSPKMNWEL